MKTSIIERVSRFVLVVGLFTYGVTVLEQQQVYTGKSYTIGALLGLRDFVVENAKCIANLALHPVATTKEMAKAVVNADQTYASIRGVVEKTVEAHPQLSRGEKGRLHARVVSETLYMAGVLVIPWIGAVKLGRLFSLPSSHVVQKVMRPATRITSKNSGPLQQTISFAEWFAYDS